MLARCRGAGLRGPRLCDGHWGRPHVHRRGRPILFRASLAYCGKKMQATGQAPGQKERSEHAGKCPTVRVAGPRCPTKAPGSPGTAAGWSCGGSLSECPECGFAASHNTPASASRGIGAKRGRASNPYKQNPIKKKRNPPIYFHQRITFKKEICKTNSKFHRCLMAWPAEHGSPRACGAKALRDGPGLAKTVRPGGHQQLTRLSARCL